jgi:hypothetical protein
MGAYPEIPDRTRGKSTTVRQVVRCTVVLQSLPDEIPANPEYSGDHGDSTRMGPSDLVGGSLSSGTRQHARIGKFRSSAQPRTQKAGLFAAWEGPSAAAAPQAATVFGASLWGRHAEFWLSWRARKAGFRK